MEFFATCGYGIEAILGDELRGLGIQSVRPLNGGVSFRGELRDAYRALLWSRVASRILLVLARVDARDSDELYENVAAISWEEHVEPQRTVAVAARGTNESLRDTRYVSRRVKDAVCDCLREKRGFRPDVDTKCPDVLIQVNLRKTRATLSLDLSGTSLENRGYRDAAFSQTAPLHETLAAALLLAADWPARARRDALLIDPVCADATIAIEAALIASDIAPGIARERWGFSGWAGHNETLWDELLMDADARMQDADEHIQVLACESRGNELKCATARAKRAGILKNISFAANYADVVDAYTKADASSCLLACNLSSIAHMSDASLPALYASVLANIHAAERIDTCALLSQDPDISACVLFEETKSFACMNGNDSCAAHVYNCKNEQSLNETLLVNGLDIGIQDAGARQFANRLRKQEKLRRKWAAKQGVFSYRIYDADLPDYNMAIDLYGGAGSDEGKRLVHVAEYMPPKTIDSAKAARRMSDALNIIGACLDVPPQCIFVKRRRRAKGGSQYAQSGGSDGRGREIVENGKLITSEGGVLFEVDLANYIDTGLFLDHRDTRALIGKLAREKSFLNLFAYTCSASVHAAAGGAKFTTSVDLSNTYLQWGRRNMEINGLMNAHQEFIRADCLAWIRETRHSRMRWDLIFVDPPTFSNSSKMGKRAWDVQRDHAEMLIGASRLLTRGGAMIFSCNLRNFVLDVQELAKAGVEAVDITEKTIPSDFERNARIHHCFLLRRVSQKSG